jgi:hypothetical protein
MRRDSALMRLSSITGAIGVATIAAVGVLGVYVAKALPGHHAATTTGSSTTSGAGGQVTGTSGTGSSINPPATPTQSAPAPAPVTSGSS